MRRLRNPLRRTMQREVQRSDVLLLSMRRGAPHAAFLTYTAAMIEAVFPDDTATADARDRRPTRSHTCAVSGIRGRPSAAGRRQATAAFAGHGRCSEI